MLPGLFLQQHRDVQTQRPEDPGAGAALTARPPRGSGTRLALLAAWGRGRRARGIGVVPTADVGGLKYSRGNALANIFVYLNVSVGRGLV